MVRRGHRGIHPGANVALDLLIWLGFLAAVILLTLVVISARAINSINDDWVDGLSDFNRGTVFDKRAFGDDLGSGIGGTAAKVQGIIGLGATMM